MNVFDISSLPSPFDFADDPDAGETLDFGNAMAEQTGDAPVWEQPQSASSGSSNTILIAAVAAGAVLVVLVIVGVVVYQRKKANNAQHNTRMTTSEMLKI